MTPPGEERGRSEEEVRREEGTGNSVTVWHEVESEVYIPNRWPAFAVGCLFLFVGTVGGGIAWPSVRPGAWLWGFWSGAILFSVAGAAVVLSSIRRIFWPTRIRHAGPDVLPEVPNEPILFDGLCVHSRLKLKLVETADGWLLEPSRDLSGRDKASLAAAAGVVLTACAGTLSCILHEQRVGTWPLCISASITATLLFGVPVMVMIGMLNRLSYRRLSRMHIPRDGDELSLELPESPDVTRTDLKAALNWAFAEDDPHRILVVSRASLRAVQLCPCKYVCGTSGGSTIDWAVQGLIVLQGSSPGESLRLPLLLTGDFDGAARLMQQLAVILRVPYLFSADAQGWKVETNRARQRPPLKVGGSLT